MTQMSAFHHRRSGTAWGNSHGPEDADNAFRHLGIYIGVESATMRMFDSYRGYETVL